jgi:hypothetical protein
MMRWKTDWNEAGRTARRAGGHLVTIGSADEDAWLSRRFGNRGPFWIGLAGSSGRWNWTTGETTAYRNWQQNRPGSGQDQSAAAACWQTTPEWRDCNPDLSLTVIIERETPPAGSRMDGQ